MLYYEAPRGKQQLISKDDAAEVTWDTWTCVLGESCRGIWPAFTDVTDVNAACVSRDGHVIATGDDFGYVKLLKYPSPVSILLWLTIGRCWCASSFSFFSISVSVCLCLSLSPPLFYISFSLSLPLCLPLPLFLFLSSLSCSLLPPSFSLPPPISLLCRESMPNASSM